ncbi:hypothetical protein HDF26_005239 [Pedobacter cryoconitis]|uniref:hypothetical protein n=1 Tax=Pedobacter cryoconitis TaxID=188932 RepID=UPI001609F5B4|nr:hypothetical protein [Pedobacter cryoconitis]MBB6274757.1 hypothetical protein [Pedobacter cryoconitis]
MPEKDVGTRNIIMDAKGVIRPVKNAFVVILSNEVPSPVLVLLYPYFIRKINGIKRIHKDKSVKSREMNFIDVKVNINFKQIFTMKRTLLSLIIPVVFLVSCNNSVDKEGKTHSKYMFTVKKQIKTADTLNNDTLRAFGEVGFTRPLRIKTPVKLQKYLKDSINYVEEVDFTGDKIPDFICKMKLDSTGVGNEYWITSNLKTVKKLQYYGDGFHYRWFINLDSDPEPEIYEAIGDEDGADYTFVDQNLKTGKDKTLLYINPVVIENDKKYWGYPWDVKDFMARTDGKTVELFCSLKHSITRDGNEISLPPGQKQMPVVLFRGHPTQKGELKGVKNEEWLSLTEIVDRTKK